MAKRPDPRKNHLLASLPAAEWARWLPLLEPVDMPLGEVLYESGMAMTHVYFPTTYIVSLLYVMEDGASAEIAVVGNEGIVGISLFMGGETTPSRSVVQSAGAGFRMRGQLLKDEFNRSGPVLHLLLRYTQALITQMAQTAVCNRHHSLDQQLCRALRIDREGGHEGGRFAGSYRHLERNRVDKGETPGLFFESSRQAHCAPPQFGRSSSSSMMGNTSRAASFPMNTSRCP